MRKPKHPRLRLRLLTSLLPLTLAACQSTPPARMAAQEPPRQAGPAGPAGPGSVSFSGGDGSSLERAVIVVAPGEGMGVRAEYGWLRQHHPGCKLQSQSLVHQGGKSYDVMEIEMPNGDKSKMYFDISLFFGKL